MVTRPHFGMFHKDMHFWLLLPITRAPRCIFNVKKPFLKNKKKSNISKRIYTFVHKSKHKLMKNLNFLFAMLLAITVIFHISCSDKENSYDETLVVASENVKTTEGIAYWVKTQIKSEKLTPFGGIFSGHTAYCLKSHCGIRGH